MIERTEPGDLTGERTIVATALGAFPALSDGGVERIRNIRYARAERFARPVAVDPEPDEASDRQFDRIACPQPPSASDALVGRPLRGAHFDEDCLRLSIARPRDAGAAPLPVMVWIHGGSYVSGAGDLGGHDPEALVREQGVIVVAVTYRLGLLGFLGDGDTHPANLGLLDLIEALRWVQEHIAAFGGDPERVTVFGQSAGADAVAHLLAADGTERLLGRVILQSAPFGIRGRREAMHERMLRAAGPLTAEMSLDELAAAQERAQQASRRGGLRSGMAFSPRYGAAPLPPEANMEAAWRRRAGGLDVLVTWTSEEAAFFVELLPRLRSITATPLVGRPLRVPLVRLLTDAVYRRDGRRFARLLAGAGARVQTAQFSGRPLGSRIGAAHAVDVALLFPNTDAWADAALLAPEGAQSLVEAGAGMRAAWAEFARTGRIAASHLPVGRGWAGELRVRDEG